MRYIRSQITWLASKALASDFQTNTHLLKAEPRRKCEEGLRCGRPRGKTVVYGLIQAELSRLGGMAGREVAASPELSFPGGIRLPLPSPAPGIRAHSGEQRWPRQVVSGGGPRQLKERVKYLVSFVSGRPKSPSVSGSVLLRALHKSAIRGGERRQPGPRSAARHGAEPGRAPGLRESPGSHPAGEPRGSSAEQVDSVRGCIATRPGSLPEHPEPRVNRPSRPGLSSGADTRGAFHGSPRRGDQP